MPPVFLGALLAIINVVFIAIASARVLNPAMPVVDLVVTYAMFPAVITGAFLGAVAGWSASSPRWARLVALMTGAGTLVMLLAANFRLERLIPYAAIPTIVACLVLERLTRAPAPPPPLPEAFAQ